MNEKQQKVGTTIQPNSNPGDTSAPHASFQTNSLVTEVKKQHEYKEMEKDIEEEEPFIRALKVGTNNKERQKALNAVLMDVHREYIGALNKYYDEMEWVEKERREVTIQRSEKSDMLRNLVKKTVKDGSTTPSQLRTGPRTYVFYKKQIKDLDQRSEGVEERYQKTIQMGKEVEEKKQKYKEMENEMKKEMEKVLPLQTIKVKENANCLIPLVQQPTENVIIPVCPDEKTLSIVDETSIRVVASTR